MKFHSPICLLLLLLPSALLAQSGQEPPPAVVEAAAAYRDQFSATISVPGTVISRNDARIASEIAGRVIWLADVGTQIKQGDPIARIDDQDLSLQLRAAKARVASLDAQIEYQRGQLKRLRQLSQSNSISVTQVDEASSQLQVSEQNLAEAKAAAAQVQRRLKQSKIIAPFSGRVVEQLTQLGEYLTTGATVVRLVDTQNKDIRVRAPLNVANYILEDMPVDVTLQTFSERVKVRKIIPVGDEQSRLFEIRLAADELDWFIGSAVQVDLPNSLPRELVAIPRDALIMRGSDTFVYRIADGGTAEKINVATGIGLGDLVEVIGDVDDGDRLITRGAERLQPGQKVTVSDS